MNLGDYRQIKLDLSADFDNLELTLSAKSELSGGWEVAFDLGGGPDVRHHSFSPATPQMAIRANQALSPERVVTGGRVSYRAVS